MIFRALVILSFATASAHAFVVPQAFLSTGTSSVVGVLSPTTLSTVDLENKAIQASSLLLSDELLGQAGEILRNVAVGVTAVIFLLAGLTFIFASFIIPQAAAQLEKEAKELAPGLWAEYEAKLGEGETMAMRPELMQELGAKMQPYIEEKIRAQQGGTPVAPPPPTVSTPPPTSGIVDAEVVSEEKKEN